MECPRDKCQQNATIVASGGTSSISAAADIQQFRRYETDRNHRHCRQPAADSACPEQRDSRQLNTAASEKVLHSRRFKRRSAAVRSDSPPAVRQQAQPARTEYCPPTHRYRYQPLVPSKCSGTTNLTEYGSGNASGFSRATLCVAANKLSWCTYTARLRRKNRA